MRTLLILFAGCIGTGYYLYISPELSKGWWLLLAFVTYKVIKMLYQYVKVEFIVRQRVALDRFAQKRYEALSKESASIKETQH